MCGGLSQWWPGEPAPVQATPRLRPLPASPPLLPGWGRPLPGPWGRPGFRSEGLLDPQSAVKREKAVLLDVWAAERSVCDRAGEEAVPVGGGLPGGVWEESGDGESCGVTRVRGREALQPLHPLLPPSPQLCQSRRTWLDCIAPGVSTACGWTDLRGIQRVRASGAALQLLSSREQQGTPRPGAADQVPPSSRPGRTGPGVLGTSPHPQTPSLPKLTADGAAESSLLFIRFPSPGKGEAEEMEGGKEKRQPLLGAPPRTLPLSSPSVQPLFQRLGYQDCRKIRCNQERLSCAAGGAPRGCQ